MVAKRENLSRGTRAVTRRAEKIPTEKDIAEFWFVPIFSNSCFFLSIENFSDSSHRLQEEQSLTIYAAFPAGDQALNHRL
jgi:hypothetical protein